MTYKSLTHRLLLICSFTLVGWTVSAQPNLDEGKALFQANCATCHAKDMKTASTGPALGGSRERWADYPTEDLYNWVKNSQALIGAGHPRANELWDEYGTIMTNNLHLTDENISNILDYVDYVEVNGVYPPREDGGGDSLADSGPRDNTLLYLILAGVLGLLALILARIVANLNYIVEARETGDAAERKTLMDILTSRSVIGFAIFALIVAGGYTTVSNAIDLGRQQNYEPTQPIQFSHATHAGIQAIDCQYCHDGARRSKHSIIPAANTCMNCHKAIKKGSTHGTAEITKIFASIGFDPSTDQYIENYDQLAEEEIEDIYKKWISDTYVTDNGAADELHDELVEEQWEGIVAALTNPDLEDNEIAGPIPWVRIHNLPDHVYFNHAQHVSVGEVECQTCHGQVEEMETLYQWSPLSMGWCVNCHRQTEVTSFADNEYYKVYEKYHEEIQNGTRTAVTVEDIGGLECQKCHY